MIQHKTYGAVEYIQFRYSITLRKITHKFVLDQTTILEYDYLLYFCYLFRRIIEIKFCIAYFINILK